MSTTKFKKMDKNEEHEMLRADTPDYLMTRSYLEPLVTHSLEKFKLPDDIAKRITLNVLRDVRVAAIRFLGNYERNKKHHFAVYFTWYMSQHINTYLKKKKFLY